jgi:hypothetical protein
VAGVKTDLVVRRVLLRGFYHGLIYTVLDDIEVVRVLNVITHAAIPRLG